MEKNGSKMLQPPRWTAYVEHPMWPVSERTSAALRYRLHLHEEWQATPREIESPLDVEHRYAGLNRPDYLTINFMPNADPDADITNWLDAIVALVGYPMLAFARDSDLPQLVAWQNLGQFPAVAGKLDVDQVWLYEGLIQLQAPPIEFGRLYFLLAQRETVAWKIGLSIFTACLPGTPDEMVYKNDHIRAAATFGSIQLL